MLLELYALGRVALGTTAVLLPAPVCEALGLGSSSTLPTAGRMLGGRDLCLGLGLYLSARQSGARSPETQRWLEACMAVDAIDGIATAEGVRTRELSPVHGALVGALVAGSIATGWWLRQRASAPATLRR